jgi:IPT/TIG domain
MRVPILAQSQGGEVCGAQLCKTGKAGAASGEMMPARGNQKWASPRIPLLAKNARNGAPGDIITSIRPTGCKATLMILSKSRPCESARWLSCQTRTPMVIRISALLAVLAILLLPVVSCSSCPATPSITSISPNSASAGAAGFSLTVNGGHFSSNAVVVWNGSPLSTLFVNSNQLTAAISATQVAQPDTALVYAYNPTGGTETVGTGSVTASNADGCNAAGSNAVSFTVSP